MANSHQGELPVLEFVQVTRRARQFARFIVAELGELDDGDDAAFFRSEPELV